MIAKYEAAAKANGAMMFPQIGIESAVPDLITWSLVKIIREKLSAKTGDVTLSIHKLRLVAGVAAAFVRHSILTRYVIT